MSRIDFVYFDAGGGHRSAATALKAVVERQARPWQVRLVNLQEVLDGIDLFRQVTGHRLQDLYNGILARGWTLGTGLLLPGVHGLIRLYHPAQVRGLRRFWATDAPDMVVSLVPNFNRALFQAYQSVRRGAPYVTVMTDLADYPPHFWIERQAQYLVCGSERARRQAADLGVRPERVFSTSGMILRPEFHDPPSLDVDEERRHLGLRPDLPTGLVLFGGHGGPKMVEIVRRLQQSRQPLQLIALAGRNEKVAARLRALTLRYPLHVQGFTPDVPRYMAASDFFLGKPGPGCISEALAMQLPVIVERNAWTLPQERFNTRWVEESGVGIVLPTFKQVCPAVEDLLSDGTLARLKANAAALRNSAVFEVAEILGNILERHPAPALARQRVSC